MTGQTVDRPFSSSPAAAQEEFSARFKGALHHAFLVFLLLLTFFPFFIAILTSFKSFQQLLVNFWLPAFPLQLHNYVFAWNEIYRSIINSSLVSLGAVTGVLLCASLAAYAFARIDFAWRDAAYYLVLSLLMIPGVLTLIGRYLLIVQFGLMNSLWGLILPYIAGGLAFAVFLLTGFFSDLPEELFEAARMDGGTELQMYRLIALPLSRPIMAIVGPADLPVDVGGLCVAVAGASLARKVYADVGAGQIHRQQPGNVRAADGRLCDRVDPDGDYNCPDDAHLRGRRPSRSIQMSEGKQYTAGIIGCGRMANLHAEAYTLVPDTQVVAAADIDPDKLDLFCERWSVPQRYRSYEEMLAQADLDIVSVVTLDNLHGPATIAAAEAGARGVFCEKPMAFDLEEAHRMIAACDRAGAKLVVDHSMRFEKNFIEVKAMIERGDIGNLRTIRANMLSTDQRDPGSWHSQYVTAGGGELMHNGTHLTDLIRFYAGDPEWVFATVERGNKAVTIEDLGAGLFRMDSGCLFFFRVGRAPPLWHLRNPDRRGRRPPRDPARRPQQHGGHGRVGLGTLSAPLARAHRAGRVGARPHAAGQRHHQRGHRPGRLHRE